MDFRLTEIEKELSDGCRSWEEVRKEEIEMLKGGKGYLVSSAFVRWEEMGEDGKKKGRLIHKFNCGNRGGTGKV